MDEILLNAHLYSGGVQRSDKINREVEKKVGYNGDCRDCLYYRDYFHQTARDEWRCDYAGEYFNDRYGNTCRDYVDREAYERRKRADEQKTQDLKDIVVGVSVAEDFQEMQEFEEEHRGEKSASFGCLTWIIIIGILFGIAGIIDKILPAPLSYIPFALVMYGLYKMHKVLFGGSETNTLLIVLGAMMAFGLFVAALIGR
ncbi:hypothetical protein [Phascolarctobacterium succinatutens]|jgi:hypothetical protein|uniref:hypothetical protein n=1 Tax=Phascolarctobacterium succinatutens TaxID=626940 RepID=UPI0026E9C93D|nr:hypothetical protein [Phascolarctobacterium succinatutens]